MTETKRIIVNVDQGIMTIQLNRPEKKNALTNAMYGAINEAMLLAKSDDAIRVVLFSGNGDCFTAGNDIIDFLNFDTTIQDAEVVKLLRIISTFEKPVVAATHGNSVGIGTTLLLHCDLVVAAKNTTFALPFVPLGLCPEAASSLLLPNLAGYHLAAELLMLGEAFNVEKAERIGLVNRVVETEDVMEEAMALCLKLAKLPSKALLYTKQLLKAPANSTEERIEQELIKFEELLHSKEAKAIFQAFLSK